MPRMVRKQRSIKVIGVWFFALFVTAGLYKSDPHLAFIQQHIDITVLFFGLSSGFTFVWLMLKRFHFTISRNVLRALYVFLFISTLLILGAIIHGNTHYGLQKALRFTILTGWTFLGPVFLITDEQSLKEFVWAILVIATATGVSAFLKWRSGETIMFVSGLGTNYLGTGRITGMGLIIVATFLLPLADKRWKRWIFFIDVLLLLFVLLISGGRGPVLSLIGTFSAFLLLNKRVTIYLYSKRVRKYFGFLIVSLFLVLIKGRPLFHVLFGRLTYLLNGGPSSLQRLEYMRMAVELFIRSPIWGMGPGSLGKMFYGIDVRLYPHNIFLELAADGGILAIAAFISLLWIAFRNGLGKLHRGIAILSLVLLAIFALLNAMVSGDLNDNRMLFAFLSLLIVSSRFVVPLTKSNLNWQREGFYER